MTRDDLTACLLTDVKARPDDDVAELYFRNTGKLLVPLTSHLFTSRHFSNPQGLESIIEELQGTPRAAVTSRRKNRQQPFNIIQVNGPPSLGKTLREAYGTHFSTKNYTRTAREAYGNPGMLCTMDTRIMHAIRLARNHNERLRNIRKQVRQHAQDKSKGYATRVFNELNKAAHHPQPTLDIARNNTYLKHLPEAIIHERDKIHELYTLLNDTPHLTPLLKEGELELLFEQEREVRPSRTLTYEELINHTWAHLDIEIPGWKTDKPEVSWVVIHYETKGDVYKREMHTASDIGTSSFDGHDVICYHGDIAALLIGVKESIRAQNPLVMTAHNGKFDYIKLRDAEELQGLEESFTPDEEDQSSPLHEASTRFFERIGTKSRLLIDFLRYAQIQYGWLPNKKLNLVAKLMLGEESFEKELSYDDLEKLEATARLYDRIRHKEHIHDVLAARGETMGDVQRRSQAAALKIASYAGKDVGILARMRASPLFTNFLFRVTDFAQRLNIPLEHLAYSSRSVQKVNERAFLARTGTEYDKLFRNSERQREEYATNKQEFRNVLDRVGSITAAPGLYTNVHLASLKYGHALKDIILKTVPQSRVIMDERPHSKEDSFLLSRYTNAFAEWLTADYAKIDNLARGLAHKRQHLASLGINHQALRTEYKNLITAHSKTASNNLFYGSLTLAEIQQAMSAQPFTLTSAVIPDARDLLYLLNTTSMLERATYKFEQQFETTYDEVKGRLELLLHDAKKIAREQGLEPIHQEGSYLYLFGDSTSFLARYGKQHPLIHSFDHALITHDTLRTPTGGFREGTQRLFYNLFGYYKGCKVVDHPSHVLNLIEMRQFDGFFKHLVAGERELALSSVLRGYDSVLQRTPSPPELALYSKSSQRYLLLEEGKKLFLRTQLPSGVTYHPFAGFSKQHDHAPDLHVDDKGRPYVLESINGEERPVYTLQLQDVSPDWHAYADKQHARIRNLLSSLIGSSLVEELFCSATSREGWVLEAAGRLSERVYTHTKQ